MISLPSNLMQFDLVMPPLFVGATALYIMSFIIYLLIRPKKGVSFSNSKLATCLFAISLEIYIAGLYAATYSLWFRISVFELLLPWIILPSILLTHLVWALKIESLS